MDDNATTTLQPEVDEALGRLLASETWSEYYGQRRSDPRQLAEAAGRFRSALTALGVDCSEVEVRKALLSRAGLSPPSALPPAVVPAEAAEATSSAPPGAASGARDTGAGPELELPASPRGGSAEDLDRAASKVLCRLYDEGCRLELRDDGHLYAGCDGSLTDEQRRLIEEHSEALKQLLTDEAVSGAWSAAVRYVAKVLGRDAQGPRADRATGLLGEAQDAYELHDNGLCRYLLRRAALVAAGRLPVAEGRSDG